MGEQLPRESRGFRTVEHDRQRSVDQQTRFEYRGFEELSPVEICSSRNDAEVFLSLFVGRVQSADQYSVLELLSNCPVRDRFCEFRFLRSVGGEFKLHQDSLSSPVDLE